MTTIEAIAAERDTLMQLVGELRTALHTPDDADIVAHAKLVMGSNRVLSAVVVSDNRFIGEIRRAAGLIDDDDKSNDDEESSLLEQIEQLTAKAAKWDAVPWDVIGGVIVGWQLTNDLDDDIADLQQWLIASKVQP